MIFILFVCLYLIPAMIFSILLLIGLNKRISFNELSISKRFEYLRSNKGIILIYWFIIGHLGFISGFLLSLNLFPSTKEQLTNQELLEIYVFIIQLIPILIIILTVFIFFIILFRKIIKK